MKVGVQFTDKLLAHYRMHLMCDVLKRVGRTRFSSIVDYGCGDGEILRLMTLLTGATNAKGIDISLNEITSGPIVLECANMLSYLPKTQYELVISNQLVEHIYEPWLPTYFHVLKESCKPEGVILISTPNRWRPNNIFRLLTLRRPYMMSPNTTGVPPEQHLGHHRECSYRELQRLLLRYFAAPEWHVRIMRMIPRVVASRPRWVANILIYCLLWVFWRPLCVSASQDHYVVIQRNHR